MDQQSTFLADKKIFAPAFSPDGKEIVFALKSKSNSKIYKVNINGTNLVLLSDNESFDSDPVFSPDGNKILFSCMRNGKDADLCMIRANGSGKVVLTPEKDHDFSPVFSPDGTKIYFVRAKFFGHYSPIALSSWHKNDIYRINIDGTGLTRVTQNEYYRLVNLSIHPDGTKLLARITELDSPYSIWIIPTKKPNQKEPVQPILDKFKTRILLLSMTSIKYDNLFEPMFSPNGKSLLFTWEGHHPSSPMSEIYLMDLESKKVNKITNLKSIIWGKPSFSQDGSQIVFSTLKTDSFLRSISKLWVVKIDGSGLQAIKL